jgi:DnaA family protein
MQQLPLDLIQTPPPTLDNYVIGPNAQAVSTVRQIAAGNPPAKIVVLCGPPGSGRSHLLNALLSREDALLASNSALTDAHDDAYRIWVAKDPDLASEAEQQQLFNQINLLRTRTDSCLLVGLRSAPATLVLREDLRTRLASGLLVSLSLLSDKEKALALQQHASARGLKADQKVLDWLLTFQDRDIRHLMAYLDAVDRYALQSRRPLSVALLREFERNHQRGPAD